MRENDSVMEQPVTRPAATAPAKSVITPWHVLATWAVISVGLIAAGVPFFWLAVPSAVAAFVSRSSGHGRLWLLYASVALGLTVMMFAFSSLFTYSVSYS